MKSCNEDYVYEVIGKDEVVLESDFVCLETAIEYATENGGLAINMLWYPADDDGIIDYGAEAISAEVVWQA